MSAPTERIVRYVGMTAAMAEQAAALAATNDAQEKQSRALIPGAVDALLASGLLAPAEKQAAAQQLADPVRRLEILTNFANEVAAKKAEAGGTVPSLGAPPVGPGTSTIKRASADSLTSPFVGARRDIGDTVAGRVFRERLGLSPNGN